MKTVFRGFVKRLRTEELGDDDFAFFDAVFPGFWQTDEYLQTWADRTPVKMIVDSKNTTWVHDGRYGRFAGRGLDRGRYFTVCRDASGADGGTLVNELKTYWYFARSPSIEHHVVIPSLTDTTQDRKGTARNGDPRLLIDAELYRIKHGVFGIKTKQRGRLRRILPLSVAEVEIENVVDLRLPKTQRLFFKRFAELEHEANERGTRLESGPLVHHVRLYEPSSFVQLLPTLVEPSPGGTIFSQAVGAWLRGHGVAGLVYPSARRDVHAVVKGKKRSFDGWNFVDYRGAPATDAKGLFGGLPHWIRPAEIGVSVSSDDSGWKLEGAERGEQARFELKCERVLGRIPADVRVPDPRYGR